MRNALGLMVGDCCFGGPDRRRLVLDLFAARRIGIRPRHRGRRAKPSGFRRSAKAADDVDVTAAISANHSAIAGDACCRPPRPPWSRSRPGALRQSGRARRQPRGRGRHHRRTRFRLRAFQAARFSRRQGSRADLRRRSVAGQHARGAQGAGGPVHQGGVLLDRQACRLSSGDSPAGLCRRAYRRHPHLVACQSQQQEDDGAAGQGRNRKGL